MKTTTTKRFGCGILALLFAVGFAFFPQSAQSADEIKWGVLIDLSGPTSDWGKNQVKGQLDAARWVNEHGGINGKELKLIVIDDGYSVDKGVAGYKRLVDSEKVIGLYIQSTGTTMTLAKKIVADGVATIAASFTSKFQNPAKTPFSFFVSPSYGTMGRIALKWIRDTWTETSRNPKICYLYPDNKYGRDILAVCKDYAKKIGVDVGPDQVINWPTKDATVQLTNMKRYDPDYAYITSTAMNGAVILKNAKALGLKTKFISNIRNFEESLIELSGGAAEGTYGVHPIAPYGAEVPGMKKIVETHEKWHAGEKGTNVYVEGWVNILCVTEALKNADKAGELTPAGIRKAFELFKDFDTGGLAPPLTFTSTDHRASMAAKIYQIQNAKMVDVSGWVELPRDMEYFGK
ncbi:MAG: ABC transporter substrate-binding protein [Deltaproteobacteria bacterium]|nr:ABC transporter substrate-binding protein [Deltaproteobacteria bacterium]MBW2041540.1 ABC transporter substrate-binding protein [Deltaproteobacteria bacterium]MBW2131569.1 ABC transporter substrate-binding protein [Deltaproteobacteria bacterium]